MILLNVVAFLVGKHGHNHFWHIAEVCHVLGQIYPTRHVMGWRYALDLLLSSQPTLGIFKTETEKQVTKDRLLGVSR